MSSSTSTSAAPSCQSSRNSSCTDDLHSSSNSTTCLSHIQEKYELRHLNDRLANYIQRVQELESKRSFMLIQMEENDESKNREMGNMRRLYETELSDVRKSLDALAGERARLEIDYGNLREEYEKLQVSCQKKDSDLATALTNWRKVEEVLNSKDAEFTKLLSENKRLYNDFADLQGQLEKVENVLRDNKTQLCSEILRRVDLENQVQTLKEELKLQTNISEQEILEIRSKYESSIVEVESGRQQEFGSKLAQAMQQLRHDQESQLQQYRVNIGRTFSSKLQNAQLAAFEKNVASATKDELETTKLKVEALNFQLQQYQKDKLMLESHFQELERTLYREREVWQQKLSQKEQELLNMRAQMYSQLEDYENLLDVKLTLDMEINAYRKMLEVEEQRLHLSPSPSQHTAVPCTQELSSRNLRGKKRKHEGTIGSSPVYKMSSHSAKHGSVSVVEIDNDGNYVKLKNNSDLDQALGGWVVQRKYPALEDISFHIPSSCILAGGQTLTIWAAGAESEAGSGDLILQDYRTWGPVTDMSEILLNPSHENVAECGVCMRGGGDETDLDFEDFIAGNDIQHFQRRPVKECKVSNIHQLRYVVMDEWNRIPVATCEALVNSMPMRVKAVLGNNGGHTNY
ncbi:lamin-B3-like [Leuresthes tenuis]|uniref:lamin-B3-like n=1 Tax=Leuresthes tenuis TaxID=355514 RepID=UPI003B5030CB